MVINWDHAPIATNNYDRKSVSRTLEPGLGLFKPGFGNMSRDGCKTPPGNVRPKKFLFSDSTWIELLIGGNTKWLRTTPLGVA